MSNSIIQIKNVNKDIKFYQASSSEMFGEGDLKKLNENQKDYLIELATSTPSAANSAVSLSSVRIFSLVASK